MISLFPNVQEFNFLRQIRIKASDFLDELSKQIEVFEVLPPKQLAVPLKPPFPSKKLTASFLEMNLLPERKNRQTLVQPVNRENKTQKTIGECLMPLVNNVATPDKNYLLVSNQSQPRK